MKLSEIKSLLPTLKELHFVLPSGERVPWHFHVTEIGHIEKNFIDCGGTLRRERRIGFQLWSSTDYDHRIHPEKLGKIIEISEKALSLDDLEIEVEYQGDTIGKFGLEFQNGQFYLTTTQTTCLAMDTCVPADAISSSALSAKAKSNKCQPGSGCCN